MTVNYTPTAKTIIYRDAEDRANRIHDQDAAIALLKSADRNDDRTLGFAIRKRATMFSWDLTGQTNGTLANDLNTEFRAIVTAHKAYGQGIRQDLDARAVSAEYAKTLMDAGDFVHRLDTALERAVTNRDQAVKSFEGTIAAIITPTGTAEQQLLAEIRAGRAWDRLTRELDVIKDVAKAMALILDRILTADPAELSVVVSDAPSYLIGRGLPNAKASIIAALAQSHPAVSKAHDKMNAAERLLVGTRSNHRRLTPRIVAVPNSYKAEPAGTELKRASSYTDLTLIK